MKKYHFLYSSTLSDVRVCIIPLFFHLKVDPNEQDRFFLLLFINDIENKVLNNIKMFADDVHLSSVHVLIS